MSGMARHDHPLKAYTQSDNIKQCIHLHLWTTYTIGRRQWMHIIIALGLHTRLDVIGCGNAIVSLEQHTRSDDVMH